MLLSLLHHAVVSAAVSIQLRLQQALQVVEHGGLLAAGLMVVAHLLTLHCQVGDFLLPFLDLGAIVFVEALHTEDSFALAMQVIGLFIQPGELRLENFALEPKDVGLGVHRVDLILELGHTSVQIFHLILNLIDGAVEGLLLGFIISLDLFELRLEGLLLIQLGSQLVLLPLDLLHQLFDLLGDVLHRGIGQIRLRLHSTLDHSVGFFILCLFLSEQLFSAAEVADLPSDLLQLGLAAGILHLLFLDFVDVALSRLD